LYRYIVAWRGAALDLCQALLRALIASGWGCTS
jgi:hypothetical protein